MSVDCKNCSNRGRMLPLSQESYCKNCIYGDQWKRDYYKPAEDDTLSEGDDT